MSDTLSTLIRDFLRNFRLADAVDIAVIAVILYSALVWFRETASRRIVVGVTLLALLYFVARTFDLYMTSQLLHGAFAILLIMLVVIFQEDLRRAFERIATMGSFRQLRRPSSDLTELDTLVQVAFELADCKVGALVVLKGDDELGRHVHGGVELHGQVSKPLLDSLFDPHSAGHDGAVIIDDGLVERFATHLPISKNRREIGSRGTRHAAALGLSERTDALIVVVSEERGVVSITDKGKLREIASPAELKGRLERFAAARFPAKAESLWERLVVRHWRMKALSVALAIIAWGMFAYNPGSVQATYLVPIEYRNVPADLEVSQWAPTETRITLSGTQPAFRLFEPATLKIALDVSGGSGLRRIIHVTAKDLSLPANLTLSRVEHNPIVIELHERQVTGPPGQPPPANGKQPPVANGEPPAGAETQPPATPNPDPPL